MIQADMTVGDTPTPEIIKEAWKQYAKRLEDYKKYREYYEGKHRFTVERKGAKIITNLVRYGIDNLVAYMAGNAPKYVCEEGDAAAEAIIERYDRQNLKEKESEIVRSLKIYGRAFELVYHDDEEDGAPPRSVSVSPENAFVVFDQSIDPDSVFGAVVRTVTRDKKEVHIMDIYGPMFYQEWTSDSKDKWVMTNSAATRFTRVPLIEYLNSEDAMSEVENVLTLQDALNAVMSDRQDDKDAFAGSMLALYNFTLGLNAEEIKENRELLKGLKVMHFESKSTDGAEYITKQMDETGAQTYTKMLTTTIHKLMRVPDFSDEQFSGNASGVAMAYKLYGTHNAAKVTEHYFGRGFRRRCKLYDDAINNALQVAARDNAADVSKMGIVFSYSTVVDPMAEAQAAQAYLAAGVSQETVLNNLSVVDDVQIEMERLSKQKAEDTAREKSMYADEFGTPTPVIQNEQG